MKHYKHIIFALFFLILLLPSVQQKIKLVHPHPLSGSFVFSEKLPFSKTTWLNGSYQTSFEKWLGDHIGFKNILVRLYNQVDFSLFSVTHAKDIVIGKNNYLFEQRYIDAYLGTDKIKDEFLDDKLQKTQLVKDSLASLGIKLLVVVAPSKGEYYSEYIPAKLQQVNERNTNYNYMIGQFSKYNIDFIDFHSYFMDQKQVTKYPLFTKCGIHWSDYAATLVADSLISAIENSLKIDMPELIINEYRESQTPSNTDYDIGHLLNIYTTIDQGILAYPTYEYHDDSSKTKPNIVVIGDSFYWNLQNMGLFSNAVANHDFWYYFSQSYGDTEAPLKDIDLKNKIENQDMVILLATAAGIQDFDMGFTNRFYSLYTSQLKDAKPINSEFQMKVSKMKANIRHDHAWMEKIKTKAKEKGISLEEMIQLDAEYMVKQANETDEE